MTVLIANSRKWLRVVFLGAALTQQTALAIAGDELQNRQGLQTLVHEMSVCAAYFSLASSVLASGLPEGDGALNTRYDTAGKLMLAQSIEVASAIDLPADVPMNWAERALQRMVKEINADPANSAAHMTKQYDEPCKELLKEFGVRAGKLLDDDNG